MLQLGGAAPLQFPVDGGNSDQEPASPRSSGGLAYAGSATGYIVIFLGDVRLPKLNLMIKYVSCLVHKIEHYNLILDE